MPGVAEAIQESVAAIQVPGTDVTIKAGDREVTLKDPMGVCEELVPLADVLDPDPWPHTDGEPDEFAVASAAAGIGSGLIEELVRLRHLRFHRIDYLMRNKKSWTSKGRTVFGKLKKPTGLVRWYSNADFVVLLNWEVWERLNPMQRIALIYHELRHAEIDEGAASTRGHDFEGFFDELELFGTRTYEEWNRLAVATTQGGDIAHQYSLSLLEGFEED